MEIFDASEIIDKTLIANKSVKIYKEPIDNAEVIGTVEAGKIIGVVYSWLDPNPSKKRSDLYWVLSTNGIFFYVKHIPGDFSVEALKAQGSESEEDKRKKEEEANMPWYEKLIKKYGIWLIGGAAAITIIKKKL